MSVIRNIQLSVDLDDGSNYECQCDSQYEVQHALSELETRLEDWSAALSELQEHLDMLKEKSWSDIDDMDLTNLMDFLQERKS